MNVFLAYLIASQIQQCITYNFSQTTNNKIKMPSFLQILKNLQDQQNPNDINAYEQERQVLDQPDLNLYDFQYDQNNDYGYRFIQYVPFQRKVIDYQQRVYKQRVPVMKLVVQQVERQIVQIVPKQKLIIDYFAVEHLRYYKKQKIPQKTIQYVPVVRTIKKTQYVPVERKIVHYPKDLDPQYFNHNKEHSETDFLSVSQVNNIQMHNVKPARQMMIKQIQRKQYGCEEDMLVTADASVLDSLSKAYMTELDREQGEGIQRGHRSKDIVSPFQYSRLRKPSTFKEIDYRSTETIDSRYFMN